MNCEDVRELAAAFSLDAVNEEERANILAHLRHCDQHADLAAERAAVMALGLTAEEREPPARLRERVLASAAEPVGPRQPASLWRRRGFERWMLAAAVVVVLVGVGVAIVLLLEDDAQNLETREFTTESGIAVRLELSFDEALTSVAFSGLEAPTEVEGYTFWAVRGDQWLRVGDFEPNDAGEWQGEFAFGFEEGDAICLTMMGTESADQPFGRPLFMEPI